MDEKYENVNKNNSNLDSWHFSEVPLISIYRLSGPKNFWDKSLSNISLFVVRSKYIEQAVGFKSRTGSLLMVTDIQISLVDGTHQKLVHALSF